MPGEAPILPTVVVTGMRASLANAQEIKHQKIEIVDSIVAEEIGKLPDQNVTDALSRITGVQILRDRGEGAGVAIRGLTQVETLMNGREIFTAGTARTVDFADLPSVMLSGIDVYKTSSAKQLEGGIGGTVDLRTPRPFDFKTSKVSGSLRAVHDDLVKKTEPQYALLASSRWQTENWGEVGMLLGAAWQKRAWREDQLSMGNPQVRTNDIIPGQTVIAANGISSSTSMGSRERSAFDAVLQWRPNDALELYAEGNYSRFKTKQDTYQINISSSTTFVPGSPVLVPGSNNLQSITWTNAPISILSFARDTVDENRQVAVGGIWKEQDTTLKADLSRTKSYSNLFFAGTILSGTAASFTQNTGGGTPSGSVSGTNLQDPANFKYTGLMYRVRPYEGDLTALRFDGEQIIGGSFIDALSAGIRLARRNGGNGRGLIYGDVTLATPIGAGSMPGYTTGWPGGNYFFGDGFVASDPGRARDPGGMYADFGIATLPDTSNPLWVWHVKEDTQAAYAMADFHGADAQLDGNAGLRIVHTGGQVTGNQTAPGGTGTVPIQVDSSYTDLLPSFNLRHAISEQTQLRAAWSKTITRQNLDQLSPSLTLIRNSVNPALNQGSAGNPDLKPIRANNLDIALENYFAPTGSVTLTGFYKRVDGFVVNASTPEMHNGEIYQISRPQNANPADIKGAELGYQQFYDALPGYGLRATYTYVDSSTPNAALKGNIPLQNLSRNSYNLIGMYELNELSVRLAYNWRSTFLSGVNSYAVGALPVYTKSYGWLDASLSYRIDKKITLVLEGNNLLRTVRRSYLVDESRPYSVIVNDRQFAVGLLFSL